MAQPQAQLPVQAPQRAFSPPQHSPSPAQNQQAYALPPNKRPPPNNSHSQPGSPYPNSPYAMSPTAGVATPGSAGSPTFAQVQQPQGNYANTPYTNGNGTTTMSLPHPQQNIASPLPTPQPMHSPAPQYTNAMMAPVAHAQTPVPIPSLNTSGVMGPPQRPADRPQKDYEYDVTDSLAGTGIDLRAEEQYLQEMYAYDAEAKTGFPQHPAGNRSSFYGSGSANQPAQELSQEDQRKFAAEAAEQVWADSAARIASQRTQEINDPFLLVAMLHRRADKIAREHHIGLNLDLKNNSQSMGRMRLPDNFSQPSVIVRTKPGPEATMVNTTGSFIPHDAFLVDQLALMSIATKSRLRDLLDDARGVAVHRQKTSHGEVPEDWLPAAGPLNKATPEIMEMDVDGTGQDGVLEGSPNPLKRSADAANKGPPAKMPKISSYMTTTMRDMAKQEREWEESRLRKRQKRRDGIADTGPAQSRSTSVAPGTPGSVAPEGSEKSMTKKELKKAQAAKTAEATNHASQNITSSMFAGFGAKSLFGKKKSKTYDWMNAGRSGSGASTPLARGTPGLGGAKGSLAPGTATPAGPMALTTEGRNRLGTWREDKEKGRNIQLRDWVSTLERDGREHKALQQAYFDLDLSGPR